MGIFSGSTTVTEMKPVINKDANNAIERKLQIFMAILIYKIIIDWSVTTFYKLNHSFEMTFQINFVTNHDGI